VQAENQRLDTEVEQPGLRRFINLNWDASICMKNECLIAVAYLLCLGSALEARFVVVRWLCVF
jgi:hypothetical protein